MKLLALLCLITTPAFAGVEMNTSCGQNYGPLANNIAVAQDDDRIEIGYITMGVFFGINVTGCQSVHRRQDKLLCDDRVIGTLGQFESTDDMGGEPRAYLTFDPARNVRLSGSCQPDYHNPLRIEVLN